MLCSSNTATAGFHLDNLAFDAVKSGRIKKAAAIVYIHGLSDKMWLPDVCKPTRARAGPRWTGINAFQTQAAEVHEANVLYITPRFLFVLPIGGVVLVAL